MNSQKYVLDMENPSTKHSYTHSSYGKQIKPVNLKLESHKVVEFMGEMDEW